MGRLAYRRPVRHHVSFLDSSGKQSCMDSQEDP